MTEKEPCPLCGQMFNPRGMGSHKGSRNCIAHIKGPKLGKATLTDKVVGNCILCEKRIEKGDWVMVFSDWYKDEYGSTIYLNNMFHAKHLKGGKEGVLARALKR